LVRETEEPSNLDVQEFESLDLYLIATLSLDPDVNLGFAAENKVLASALNKALGTLNLWANDLGTLIGKGQGRLAWERLKVRVNGTAQASSARVTTLEGKLRTSFRVVGKGQATIQAHNSVFLKTVQDLATVGSVLDDERQIREYLMSIQDPSLASLKDMIRADATLRTVEPIMDKIVDVLKGAWPMPWPIVHIRVKSSRQSSEDVVVEDVVQEDEVVAEVMMEAEAIIERMIKSTRRRRSVRTTRPRNVIISLMQKLMM
jgi:hypothetical protein